MTLAMDLIEFLNSRDVNFHVDRHAPAATALETAEAEHVSGKRFAKTVVLRDGDELILAVLPAHLVVDVEKLEELAGGRKLFLATEDEFANRFPECEVGAMPPFGKLYAMRSFIDDDLAVAPEVTFNACSHEYAITMPGQDFLKLFEGVVGDFSAPISREG